MEHNIEELVDSLMDDHKIAIAWNDGDVDYVAEVAFRRFGEDVAFKILNHMFH